MTTIKDLRIQINSSPSLGRAEKTFILKLLDLNEEVGNNLLDIQEELSTNSAISSLALLTSNSNTGNNNKTNLSIDNPPLYCFSVNNNSATSYTRNIVNQIYLDGLFNSNKDVSLNRSGSFAINPKQSGIINLPLKSDSYSITPQSINNYVTNLTSVTSKIKIMGIGASLTALQLSNPDGTQEPYWGIISRAVYNILRDTVDQNTIPVPVMVGHFNVDSRSFTYKGNTLTVKGGNAAIASWAGTHYLRHAIRLTSIVTGLDPSANGYVNPDISYYLLGLQGQTGSPWNATVTQQELIRTTVMGKNTCDKNGTLYDWMKVQTGWGGAVDTYTGTVTQNTNMDNFLEYLLDNPKNPFYSKTRARTAGSTNAFSLTEYLNRYKTLANDGVTRLVVGSTAGTKVTDVNAWDVCMPSHVTINFFENDLWLFPNASISDLVATMREIGQTILLTDSNIKVAFINTPRPGTLFPEYFTPGVRYPKEDALFEKSTIRNEYIKNLGITKTNPKSGNLYYLDAYQYMYPLSHQYGFIGESAGSSIDFEETSLSGVHPGLKANATTGDQIYGWLYYSSLN